MFGKTTYTVSKADFDAVIFDLDGVVTDTATVHANAWKRMFDDFLKDYASSKGIPFEPFDIDKDYRLYVDGKPRFDGVKSFLESRGIDLIEGGPDDEPGRGTVHGLGNAKNGYFLKQIEEKGVEVYGTTVDLIHCLKKHGFKTAIISSSKNCAMLLDSANLSALFDVRVDGIDSEDGVIHFNPSIPHGLQRLSMKIKYRGNWFDVITTPEAMTVSSSRCKMQTVKIGFGGKMHTLKPGETLFFDIKK